jgi:polyhydroxyalkanoate synthesis regulator protein
LFKKIIYYYSGQNQGSLAMNLEKIRQAYDQNYQEMLEIIQKMGGDKQIKYHRKNNTPLFQKLRKLQKIEHRLDNMESHWHEVHGEYAMVAVAGSHL